ncbi:hypothetical protein C8A03DRAFT_44579 [Achaetomium macrosporum]|uniref:RING-type E3 ubiquitin transferase n=1 Tax=Achaetomium macrosporum TaxID=79813 RepID=A0AAN7CAS8_9PEZI|nr:hypothetical protein C8A03DRAFT_44579 [Achaetomium macrosporum]
MDAVGVDHTDDIQAQVLQTTLAEIKTSREKAADSASPDDATEPGDCCVICLDSISEACTALPCSHAHFDFVCLVSWLQEHPNCPLCKANIYKVRYAGPQKAEAIYRVPNAARTRNGTGRDERIAGENRQTHLDSASRRRFTSHNGLLRESDRRHPRSPPSETEAIQRRRHIYRHQLYSLHIGSNRISGYRPLPTPAQLSSTPHLLSRARLWIRRELQVFSFLSSDPDYSDDHHDPIQNDDRSTRVLRRRNNAEFLLEYVVAILKTVDIQGSVGQAEAMLADFLGRENARLFLHELRSWLRSPAASLAAWDREVRYPELTGNGNSTVSARRGSISRDDEGEDQDQDQAEGGGSSARGGASWRDRAGDHWRAGCQTGVAWSGERRKRKGRDDDEAGKGRASRPRRTGEWR